MPLSARLLPARPRPPRSAPRPNHQKFDDSGQVYTEVSCPGAPMTSDWVWKTRGSTQIQGQFRSPGPGCSTLFNMAVRSALRHSYNITPENLQTVPWEVGRVLWERIVSADLTSLQSWLTFTNAYPPPHPPALQNHHKTIPHPTQHLSYYLTPTLSPQTHFLTFLTLTSLTTAPTALLQLCTLPNLGTLTIGPNLLLTSSNSLDDTIIRTWSRSAAAADGFRMLRCLHVRSAEEISPRVFDYLNSFPLLAIFSIENCPRIKPADKPLAWSRGWKYRTGKDLADWLVRNGEVKGASWGSVSRALFKIAGRWGVESLTAEGVEAVDALPVLHFAVGGTPKDATVDCTGQESLRCFERVQRPVEAVSESVGNGVKRRMDGGGVVGGKRKKPVMRVSKRQDLESLLVGFGS